MHPVQIEGSSVILREFQADDLEGLAAIVGDDRVTASLSFDSRDRSEVGAMLAGITERSRMAPREEYYLAVTQDLGMDVLGLCRLALSGVQAAKLGFAIHADHWGRGLATSAATTMVEFGFETLKLHRISAAVGPANETSLAIVKKLGLTYEGRLRDHVFTNGEWRDSLLFSILARDQPQR